LKLEYYLNFEAFYNNNSYEEKKIDLETYKILYNQFSKAFYNSMNDFINIKSNEINEKMNNFSTKIWNENEENNNIYDKINTNNYLNSDNDINVNINLIKRLEPIVDQFVDLEPENELIKDIKNDFEFLKHYIYKDRKIRVPIFGGYSTGKSSLLNSLIGFGDILPTGSGICTKRGIIIRNNPKEL
jgi:ribosome biogenesis GTPase A